MSSWWADWLHCMHSNISSVDEICKVGWQLFCSNPIHSRLIWLHCMHSNISSVDDIRKVGWHSFCSNVAGCCPLH
jgi:hypothetical protein